MLPHRDLTGRILAIGASLAIAVATVGAQQPPQPGSEAAAGAAALAVSGSRPAARPHHVVHGGAADSIKPGESVTLKWAVENPRTTTIEPTVGRAVPPGN